MMPSNSILLFYHFGANIGYAIEKLEPVFFQMAKQLVGSESRVHVAYPNYDSGRPRYLPDNFNNLIEFNGKSLTSAQERWLVNYIKTNRITVAFGFDQPVRRQGFGVLRKGGVKHLISYQGAPMSQINHGLKLLLKRLEVSLSFKKPDFFIFESKAMQQTAVCGRGIRYGNTAVVPMGVDTEQYSPNEDDRKYAYDTFAIPENRKIVFYSGHMEERKGVRVIIKAAKELVISRGVRNVHFLFLGNKPETDSIINFLNDIIRFMQEFNDFSVPIFSILFFEKEEFDAEYRGTLAEEFITFGGYRGDIPRLLHSAYLGCIASTGWDSYTMSSLEMAASGLPLLVSRLQGLAETVEEEKTGLLFEPGDYCSLADHIERLLNDKGLRDRYGLAARERVIHSYSRQQHINNLVEIVERVISR